MGSLHAKGGGPIVDITTVERAWAVTGEIDPYELACLLPPWSVACVAFTNRKNNVIAALTIAFPWEELTNTARLNTLFGPWESEHGHSLEAADQVIEMWLYLGGRDESGRPFPTSGPFHLYRAAIDSDGRLLDMHWVDMTAGIYPPTKTAWDASILLSVFNLMNCRNVELMEPQRKRSRRREEARLGIRTHVIGIRPVGRSTRSAGSDRADPWIGPLHSVRGHMAHYGDCCPGRHQAKGKLFGRTTGRFWIPQHARGSAQVGHVDQAFNVEPS
jgi:hypothetical protein